MQKNKVTLIKGDDYEALYINGELKVQGHTINEGIERGLYFLVLAESFGVTSSNICFGLTNDEGEKYLSDNVSFPNKLSKFEGKWGQIVQSTVLIERELGILK